LKIVLLLFPLLFFGKALDRTKRAVPFLCAATYVEMREMENVVQDSAPDSMKKVSSADSIKIAKLTKTI
jgi:hypothetical protein